MAVYRAFRPVGKANTDAFAFKIIDSHGMTERSGQRTPDKNGKLPVAKSAGIDSLLPDNLTRFYKIVRMDFMCFEIMLAMKVGRIEKDNGKTRRSAHAFTKSA